MIKEKKGGILDWFFIISILFISAVSLIVGKIMLDRVDASGVFAGTTEAQDIIDTTQKTFVSFDNMMLFVLVGLSIFVIVSSAVVYHHPAYFFIGVFLLAIAITVGAIASNTFWIFSNHSLISSTMVDYPKLEFIMENIPFYVAFMGMASLIAMFVSFRRQ